MSSTILLYDPTSERKNIVQFIEQIGDYEVETAETIEIIYELLDKNTYHLFITEIELEGYSLTAFLTKITQFLTIKNIPLLVLTQSHDIFTITLAESLKAVPILYKPIEPELFIRQFKLKLLNKKKGLFLCSSENKSLFEDSFKTMGFEMKFSSKMVDFMRHWQDPDIHFIAYEEGAEGTDPIAFLNRISNSSLNDLPLFYFIRHKDVILDNVLKKRGKNKMVYFPLDWDAVPEVLEDLLIESYWNQLASLEIKDLESEEIPVIPEITLEVLPPAEGKKPLTQAQIQEEKARKKNFELEETESGSLSVMGFIQSLSKEMSATGAIGFLIHFLKNGSAFQRQQSIEALNGPQGGKLIPLLANAYKNGNNALRRGIMDLFSSIKPNPATIDTLSHGLFDRISDIQYLALLGFKGYDMKQVGRFIRKKLVDPKPKIRVVAATYFEQVRDLSFFPDLLHCLLLSEDNSVRRSFLKYLDVNYPDLPNLNALTPIFHSSHTLLKESILDLLISKKDKRMMPFLTLAVASEERTLVRLGIEGFKIIQAPEGVSMLLGLLESRDSGLAQSAIETIMDSNASPKYLTLFLDVMKRGDDNLKEYCFEIIKNFNEKEAIPIFRAALNYGSAPVKIAAIDAMNAWKSDVVFLLVGPLLDNQDKHVREAASRFIEANVTRSAIENLIRVFLIVKQEESKRFIADVLAKLIQGADEQYLAKMLRQDSYSILIRILKNMGVTLGRYTTEVLGKYISKNSSFDIVLKTLYEANAEARAEAAIVLGEQGNPDAIPHLARFLEDENWDVRRVVAESLGKLNAVATVPLLIKKMKDDNPSVRAAVAATLAAFDVKFKEPLFPTLIKEDSDKVRENMILLLAPFNDQKTAEVYLPKLLASSLSVRVNAASSLLFLWDELDQQLLFSWLQSDKWYIRLMALSYFTKKNPDLIREQLPVLLKDNEEEIKKFVISFIVNEEPKQRIELLSGYVKDPHAEVRRHLIQEMERKKHPGIIEFICSFLETEKDDNNLHTLFDILTEVSDPRILESMLKGYPKWSEKIKKRADVIREKYKYETSSEDKRDKN
ncbi:MAG: HEAT repeat domain-containing protein [Candidatus Aureabacteria bacterium]|nr:HEAT repeat domain-containing protein [Candidatus Auribacterota bacterium]